MDEQKRQLVKEEAIKEGIERGMALMREDLKMYGMKGDGEKTLICEAKDYDSLWEETLENINLMTKTETTDKAEEYLNNWKRERADFLNYKKDETKRLEEFVRFANEDLLMETIETLDDLEKAAKEINNDGLNQVLKKFHDLLGKYGTERIKVKDEKFNPVLHEAVTTEARNETTETQKKTEKTETDTTEAQKTEGNTENKEEKIEEVRAGYTMHGKVIRPARIKIIK